MESQPRRQQSLQSKGRDQIYFRSRNYMLRCRALLPILVFHRMPAIIMCYLGPRVCRCHDDDDDCNNKDDDDDMIKYL